MFDMARKLLLRRTRQFRLGRDARVTVAFHYTVSAALASIATNGLLSRADQLRSGPCETWEASQCGWGPGNNAGAAAGSS